MMNNQASFSAASVFPAKLLKTRVIDKKGRIIPIHIQFNPTNVCNFNCSFCSCANRDKKMFISFDKCKELIKMMHRCGTKAVTITGGGEPVLHPQINEMIDYFWSLNIKVGLVTNGMAINLLTKESLKKITWIRISASVEYNTDKISIKDWFRNIEKAVKLGPTVDWAFSYVLTKDFKIYNFLIDMINFANNHNFTHVRLVSDLLDLENVRMNEVKYYLQENNIDLSKVIFQPRKEYMIGRKKCLISLLKPVIGADGKLYPCCGTQYALAEPTKDYEKTMTMGDAQDLDWIYENQDCFDGSKCVKCYYDDYNFALNIMTDHLKHEEFV
jgi:MoaA/NifB/PqqE/SkfB family radical SAM enzyme